MKAFTVLVLTTICLINVSFSAKGKSLSLAETLEQFNHAFIMANVNQLDSMLSNDYQHTNSGNKPIDKQTWLKWVSSRKKALEAGELVYRQYKTEDLVIQQHGSFAVVTGRNIAIGINKNQSFEVDIRFTHVWIEDGKHWKRLAFQDAPSKD